MLSWDVVCDGQQGVDQARLDGSRDDTCGSRLHLEQAGGDAVCWLERVCDGCGGLSDGPPGPRCDRCGAAQT